MYRGISKIPLSDCNMRLRTVSFACPINMTASVQVQGILTNRRTI